MFQIWVARGGGDITTEDADLHAFMETINTFLRGLPEEARNTFVGRYYFVDSIQEIASYYGMAESKVKSMLHRTRMGLKANLEQEGFL